MHVPLWLVLVPLQELEGFCKERRPRCLLMKVLAGGSDQAAFNRLTKGLSELEVEVTVGAALDTNAIAIEMQRQLKALATHVLVSIMTIALLFCAQ